MLHRTHFSVVVVAVILLLASYICGSAAERKREAKRDLIVFVGKRLSVTKSEPTPAGKDVMMLDAQFEAHYKILRMVFGSYKPDEISFTVYDHYGEPEFSHYDTALMFVSRHEGKLYHEKYLFFRSPDGQRTLGELRQCRPVGNRV